MSSITGAFSGAVTSYKQGKEQKKMYQRQSSYLQREAELVMEKRDEEIEAAKTAATSAISTAKAKYGSSGVVGWEGSSAEVLSEMEKLSTEELARMEYWKQKEYEGYQLQRGELRRAGRLAVKAGKVGAWSGAVSGVANIASSVIGGIGGAGGFAGGSAGSFGSSFLGS